MGRRFETVEAPITGAQQAGSKLGVCVMLNAFERVFDRTGAVYLLALGLLMAGAVAAIGA